MDVNALFSRAEQAFARGELDGARADVLEVRQLAGDHPAVLHLLALIEKKRGALEPSRAAFVTALRLAPGDPQINNNYANLLDQMGEDEAALDHYARALATDPSFKDARLNRALLLHKLRRYEEALAELDLLAAAAAGDARVHSARGNALREQGRMDEAAAAYDAALRISPAAPIALHGRARVALERGEPDASARYEQALRRTPGDPDLVLGIAEALEAEGDRLGIDILRDAAARNPGWLAAHEVLARMRSEAGEAETFADHYERALEQRPRDPELHHSYWRSLARGELHEAGLRAVQAARALLPADRPLLVAEAAFTSDSGDPEGALRLLDTLGDARADSDLRLLRGRVALRAGRVEEAAAALERLTREDPGSIAGWAYLGLCWRLLGDDRHQWLCGQDGLVASRDIGLGADELDRLAGLLRSLHRTSAHPIGQSLRGGTQTRGRLFWRQEPELARLCEAIETAVATHVAGLPNRDAGHPLLRHRDQTFTIDGSWSVRLMSQGFHVSHIHPLGLLSSACYISLPAVSASGDSRNGWLELGRPPADLGLSLEPLVMIEPKPGRLALFPSYHYHGTRPFREGERLTVAFDINAR